MGFGDLKSAAGLNALNDFFADRSYIEGYTVSQADVVVFGGLSGAPSEDLFHALRWYNQTKSYSSQFDSLPGVKKPLDQYGSAGAVLTADDDDDDDDDDLFASDDETDAAVEKLRQDRLKMYAEKKKTKKVVIAKSNVIWEVKPWDDETDMKELEAIVRNITMDGLLWGASKLVPVGYGIQKLQITSVIVDDKVSTQDLEDLMTSHESHIQSADIISFNKI